MYNPFIPLNKADTVIVAGNVSEQIYKSLLNMNLKVVKTIAHKEVHSSIMYHPDLVIHPINRKLLIIEPTVFNYYKDKLQDTDIELIKGEKKLKLKYPLDIGYNVGRVSNLAIHNFKYTDEKLIYYLKKENLELINVNQGYTKCSIAIVGKKEIITSDTFIDERLRSEGIKSLLIKPGNIILKNQEYGFIGGCTGNISNDEVILSGSLNSHPDKEKIKKFLFDLNKKVVYLSKEAIEDIGTIIALNSN